jgi:hypothetical protein
MEKRADVRSILPFLPLQLRGSSFAWPEGAEDSIKSLSMGPTVSHVDSGDQLFEFILALRNALGFSSERPLSPHAADGFSLFFDQVRCLFCFLCSHVCLLLSNESLVFRLHLGTEKDKGADMTWNHFVLCRDPIRLSLVFYLLFYKRGEFHLCPLQNKGEIAPKTATRNCKYPCKAQTDTALIHRKNWNHPPTISKNKHRVLLVV